LSHSDGYKRFNLAGRERIVQSNASVVQCFDFSGKVQRQQLREFLEERHYIQLNDTWQTGLNQYTQQNVWFLFSCCFIADCRSADCSSTQCRGASRVSSLEPIDEV